MSAPDPLPETGGVFFRDATGALIPAAAQEAPEAPEQPAPEAVAPAPLKKDRRNA